MEEIDGQIDFSVSHVPVLEGSYKDRGRGQLRDTSKGQPRSKSRVVTLLVFITIERVISRGIVQSSKQNVGMITLQRHHQ